MGIALIKETENKGNKSPVQKKLQSNWIFGDAEGFMVDGTLFTVKANPNFPGSADRTRTFGKGSSIIGVEFGW